MRGRHSSNPIDKVCAIAFPFQKRQQGSFHVTFPIYDPSTPVSVAWERLISSIASTKMEFYDESTGSPTIKLLCLFPHPSRHHWFPSWAQLQFYPDVSVWDNDPVTAAGDMDYSLRIVSGRISVLNRRGQSRRRYSLARLDHQRVQSGLALRFRQAQG